APPWQPIARRAMHTLHAHVLERMRRKAEAPQAKDKQPPLYEPQDSKLYLPPRAAAESAMTTEPTPPTDHRPAGSQFSLRGMFALLTATSVMFAILALVIRSPVHWLGALAVPVICVGIMGAVE